MLYVVTLGLAGWSPSIIKTIFIPRGDMDYIGTIDGAINSTVDTITLNSTNGLPNSLGGYYLILDDLAGTQELVQVLSINDYDIHVLRGQGGTTATSWSDGDSIRGFKENLVLAGTGITLTTDLDSGTILIDSSGGGSSQQEILRLISLRV